MEDFPRPSEEHLKTAYDRLFNSGISFSKLRDATLEGRLFFSPDANTSVRMVGRSVAWKLFLMPEGPLQSSLSRRSVSLLENLRTSRQKYATLLEEKMRAPDGSYGEGFLLSASSDSLKRPAGDVGNLETNNPLSLHDENPWREWFSSVDLRKTISQDVERTFPDIPFFRNSEVQLQLTNILFLYSTLNPGIGYRQGMHEVLAPLYHALDHDSVAQDGTSGIDQEIQEMCSRTYIAADSWALFTTIMCRISKWYEWREPLPQALLASQIPSPLHNHVHLNIPDGKLDIKPYVTPIVATCNRIQSDLLRATDPLLWKHMQSTGIEPQIYGIRWLRLLFTREFSLKDAMRLWDSLFACDPTFELAPWICVAMLIRIRNQLIPADYSGQLMVLLRYPSPRSSPDDDSHHMSLLLRQALALQMSPTASTGASLVTENCNLLKIPSEVPALLPTQRSHAQAVRDKAATISGRSTMGSLANSHSRQQTSGQLGLPEMIARGLLERGESLGINKTLMSAVAELRRSIPDLAASLGRSSSPSSSMFPLMDERPPEERPTWEPGARFEIERNISKLRSGNKRLGEALGWIVDVLLQDETAVDDRQRLQKHKREALESLSYVRDILMGNETEIEETRLISEEELIKRNSKHNVNKQPSSVTAPAVPSPVRVPVVDSRQQSTSSLARRLEPSTDFGQASKSEGSSYNRVVAPWVHSASAFSGPTPSTLPAESLPRLPPPTSVSLRRPSPNNSSPGGHKATDQTPHRTQAHHDPLGVLR